MEATYLSSLTATTIAQASKDLTRLPSAKLKGDGSLRLQPGNSAAKLEHCFRFVHDVALVHEIFQPVVRSFDLASHVGQFQTDDWVIDESLAESAAFVCVLDRLLVTNSGEADALNNYADTLVVEVGHYHYGLGQYQGF